MATRCAVALFLKRKTKNTKHNKEEKIHLTNHQGTQSSSLTHFLRFRPIKLRTHPNVVLSHDYICRSPAFAIARASSDKHFVINIGSLQTTTRIPARQTSLTNWHARACLSSGTKRHAQARFQPFFGVFTHPTPQNARASRELGHLVCSHTSTTDHACA